MATRKAVKGDHDIFTLAYKTQLFILFAIRDVILYSYVIKRKNFHSKTMPCFDNGVNLIFEQFCTFQRITRVCGMKDDVKKEISISLYKVDLTKACCCTNFRFFLAKKKEEKNFGLLRVAKKLKVF